MTGVPDAAVRAALAEHRSLLADRPDPMVLSDEALFRRVLEAALPHLPGTGPDLTALPWRQGRHEPRHMYARLGPEASDDDPIVGTLDTAEAAAEACEAHNVKAPAVRLLEEALFLRTNGEYAPGGRENWHDWDMKAETFLRGLLPPEASP